MKEKIRRILDLIRAGKLSLDDAAPLLAALSPKLALTEGDREFVSALLGRPELDAAQVAEHLMLLRGVRDAGPTPPPPPQPPRRPQVVIGGQRVRGLDGLVDRITGGIDTMVDTITTQVERELHGVPAPYTPGPGMLHPERRSARILHIHVESQHGDEYSANIPVSLAPHLDRLIPPHGQAALESAGFTLDALRLLIEASPHPGPLIDAEDQHGNEVHISLN
ncbi:hypothetical protein GCM10008956_27480 [Deinococcus arenae]|uniref:YvlB/LiaX N-terminal domain-containing protein n=1 Tax=Deinococcus arenae TaxID=1452751 RepID=A0A8H9GQX0_9DEIO|nr:hypothetical protein [Deinococcus arenae]AWT36898.1 hypothetical protein DM785_16130 [Deinococcus actinosclerus]GGM49830.1 hypothetical protein GCM10008956_27480 [Deinococcus arenae]